MKKLLLILLVGISTLFVSCDNTNTTPRATVQNDYQDYSDEPRQIEVYNGTTRFMMDMMLYNALMAQGGRNNVYNYYRTHPNDRYINYYSNGRYSNKRITPYRSNRSYNRNPRSKNNGTGIYSNTTGRNKTSGYSTVKGSRYSSGTSSRRGSSSGYSYGSSSSRKSSGSSYGSSSRRGSSSGYSSSRSSSSRSSSSSRRR